MSVYLLKKGNHYASGLHFGVHFGITEQQYKIRFSKECLYTPLDWENDYNKLCGWSYGMHHTNSIRVCWRPYVPVGVDYNLITPTLIELCIYVYENSTRKISQKTLLVDVEKDYDFDLKYDTSTNTILLNFPQLGNSILLYYITKPTWGYRLYPFFGGNGASPQDMNVTVQKL